MPDADLYLDRIDPGRYLSADQCRRCGAQSCKDLVTRLLAGTCLPEELDSLPVERRRSLWNVVEAGRHLPVVPSLQLPRPSTIGLVELNQPGPGDPVLVTGNNEFTQQVLLAVLSTTVSPFYLLFTDTRGDTLDMAVLLGSFTPARILQALQAEDLMDQAGSSRLVLPGLAEAMRADVAARTGWPAEAGPVCAAELPLYFGSAWEPVSP